jgi:hypothetical protein
MHDIQAEDGHQTPPSRLQKAKHVLAEEFRSYMLSFFYFWVLLGTFTVHQDIALREHDISFAPHGWALVNALVLAKVMVVVEKLRLGSRIVPHPLIYPIVIEAFILALLFIGVHVLEHVVAGLVAGERAAASIPLIGGGGFIGLCLAALSVFIALIPFCGFRQLSIALGPGRMRSLLFSPPPSGG